MTQNHPLDFPKTLFGKPVALQHGPIGSVAGYGYERIPSNSDHGVAQTATTQDEDRRTFEKALLGGLDLASARDLCAFRLLSRHEGIYYTWGRRWVPAWAVSQRTERGTMRYDHWVAAGYASASNQSVGLSNELHRWVRGGGRLAGERRCHYA